MPRTYRRKPKRRGAALHRSVETLSGDEHMAFMLGWHPAHGSSFQVPWRALAEYDAAWEAVRDDFLAEMVERGLDPEERPPAAERRRRALLEARKTAETYEAVARRRCRERREREARERYQRRMREAKEHAWAAAPTMTENEEVALELRAARLLD